MRSGSDHNSALLPAEAVRMQCAAVVSREPRLISFDLTDEAGEMLALRCAVDPGVPAQQRDGWRGIVVAWYVGPYEVADEKTGEVVTLPSLVLIDKAGHLCRLSGWPAVNSWAQVVRVLPDHVKARGVPVRVMRRQSGTAGRSYWLVMPDSMPVAPGSIS